MCLGWQTRYERVHMSLNKTISSGPLQGVKVIEFAGMGPGPFACMLLSDMGAEVIRIDRPGARAANPSDIVGRGRKTLLLDLKLESARTQVLSC